MHVLGNENNERYIKFKHDVHINNDELANIAYKEQ